MTTKKFIEPSAAGPSSSIDRQGVVRPGKSFEAHEGEVTNPGVKKVHVGGQSGRICPVCRNASLKMHMNKPVGQRVYCSMCSYDTSRPGSAAGTKEDTRVVNARGINPNQRGPEGVKILRGTGV